jgi:galactonate dehydratase
VARRGFKGLKTNVIRFDSARPYIHGPGTNRAPGYPELNIDSHIVEAAVHQLEALRKGGAICRPASRHQLQLQDRRLHQAGARPRAVGSDLARDRHRRPRRVGTDPALGMGADRVLRVAVWSAPVPAISTRRSSTSPGTAFSKRSRSPRWPTPSTSMWHRTIFRVMEIDIDDVLSKDDIVTAPPVIENGDLLLPTCPGWGADVDEAFVRAHPPQH